MTYENVNRFIVILDDDRDPDVSWQNHLERGSAGGVDCVAPMRTRLYAPTDCIVSSYWGGTGGTTIHMAAVDEHGTRTGWADEFMHADEAPVTGRVPAGGFVGYSGRSGGDYAPHVHWHRIDPQGRRRNPWHFFTGSTPAGSGDHTPIITPSADQEDTMRIYSNIDEDGRCYLFFDTGWQAVDDSTEATNLAQMLLGKGEATKVYGGQINWLKRRCDANRAALVAAGARIDPAVIARELSPLLAAPIIDAIRDTTDIDLTADQVQAAAERAVRAVFGGLG